MLQTRKSITKLLFTCSRFLSTTTTKNSSVINQDLYHFLLFDVLNIDKHLLNKNRYSHVTSDIINDVFLTTKKIAENKFANHNKKNDQNEPQVDLSSGKVVINEEVKEALQAYKDAGFFSVHADQEVGGLQLPFSVTACLQSSFTAANCGTTSYPFLTIAASNMLRAVATPEQQEKYLLPMLQGNVYGTMNLSETQAGSSLGDIKTFAIKRSDGHYNITGQKMWISGGDHELSDNIFHMVLAKVRPGDESEYVEKGVKSISLFVVPKYRLEEDGRRGKRNGVALAGLNHKMGYRGTANCVMVYGGEGDEEGGGGECIGELIGEEGNGLAAMFHMMNEARISVGLGAAALGHCGYVKSLEYARERKQGRTPGVDRQGMKPSSPQVPIIQHADVKRMLLVQKSYVEGALSLGLYGCSLVDMINVIQDEILDMGGSNNAAAAKEKCDDMKIMLDTLTPIIKSWPSEWCLEANKWAIQIHGGYGYTRDYDVEQIYRDNRLNMIHEGTNGIQSIDLLGRKIHAKNGRGLRLLVDAMTDSVKLARSVPENAPGYTELCANASALESAASRLLTTTQTLLSAGKESPGLMLANSHEYLNFAGHIVIAWQWLKMESVATHKRLAENYSERPANFYVGKQLASNYFFKHELPKTVVQAELLCSLDDVNLAMKDEYF